MKLNKLLIFFTALLFLTQRAGAFEISLHGGPLMNIPEAWVYDDSDPSVPTWYSPDRSAGAEVKLWAPGTWKSAGDFLAEFRPEGAVGNEISFPCWDGDAALANWEFSMNGNVYMGWFLFTAGSGPDVKISVISLKEDFPDFQAFMLSIIDSYAPSSSRMLEPGAVGRFLELSGEHKEKTNRSLIGGHEISWETDTAANQAAQDVIEREALVLAAYASVPQLFYPAWERYYKIIYRDSYSRLDSLSGELENLYNNKKTASEQILSWFQSFSYGSTDGFSDLLAPSTACEKQVGDCDSLSLAYLIIMKHLDVEGCMLLTQSAKHAVAALDIEGNGARYTYGDKSFLTAEMTSSLKPGVLPERLANVNDWFCIDFSGQ